MDKEKFSITRVFVFSVITFLLAFSLGYYFGNDNSKKAVVIESNKEGLVNQAVTKISDVATKECNFRIYPGSNNEPKALLIDKLKIVDIDSYKVVGSKLFYSAGPLYGKPEIGMIDCISFVKKTVVAAENTQGNYPYGSDYFRIKKVFKELSTEVYNIQYWYGGDVDKIDFKKFESDENVKTFVFKN